MTALSFASPRRSFALAAVLALLHLSAAFCDGAVEIFIRFKDGTGEWAGESTAPGRTGWAKVASFTFGASNVSPSGETALTGFDSPSILKPVDRLSPTIFFTLASGEKLEDTVPADAVVEFVRAGPTPFVFLRVEFKVVTFQNTSTAASEGTEVVYESIGMNARAMRVTYIPTTGAPISKSWNLATNSPDF